MAWTFSNGGVQVEDSALAGLPIFLAIHCLFGWWAYRIASARRSAHAVGWGCAGFFLSLIGVGLCALISGPSSPPVGLTHCPNCGCSTRASGATCVKCDYRF